MNEKNFILSEEGTNRQFKLIISYNSSKIDMEIQNKDNSQEKYELKNLNLAYFNKIRAYEGYSSIEEIVDAIAAKLEKNNFILRTGCVLNIKFTGPNNEVSYVPFVIKNVGIAPIENSNYSESELKEENERLLRENLELKAQLEKLSSGNTIQKPISSSNSYSPPKTDTNPPPPKPPVSKPTPPPVKKPKPPQNLPSNSYRSSQSDIQIEGAYIPPSMNKNGNIFDRINQTIKLKKDMKQTLDEIYNRLIDTKRKIDNFVDKAFANNPTENDKKKALSLITEVLLLRQGFKDLDDYAEIFKNEVKQKHITFNSTDQERFDDDMIILGKAFPYALTPFHQKIDHLFVQVQHNFFKEKNLRFYKERELTNVLKLKDKLFNKL